LELSWVPEENLLLLARVVSPLDRAIFEEWTNKTDEAFLEDFALQDFDDMDAKEVKQILFIARKMYLLKEIAVSPPRKANRVAFPEFKRHFVNFSAIRLTAASPSCLMLRI
jgi:hypothetical protein